MSTQQGKNKKKKQLAAELEISEEKVLDIIMDNLPDMIYIKDTACRFLKNSKAHARSFGVDSPKELVGKSDFDFFSKESAQEKYADEQKIMQSGKPLIAKVEKEKGADGRVRWMSSTKVPVRNAQGKVIGLVGMSRDITEYKRGEEELRKHREYLEASRTSFHSIVEKSADGIIIVDEKGLTRFVNRTAEVFFGCRREKLINKSFGVPVVAGEVKELDIIRDGGKTGVGEMRVVQTQWEGKVAYLVSVRDITERKKIEQMKNDFISLVSHQLKTPVAIIRGYIENMLMGLTGDLMTKQREYLEEMQGISSRNYHLISDLLNVSRIERGVISVDIQPVELKEIIDLSLRSYDESIKKKGLALHYEGVNNGIIVLADKDKMVEALKNIVENAVKFTSEGSITVKTKREKDFAIAEVIDTGKGMPQEVLSKLFTKDQIFNGSPRIEGGCSLGLYIAKEFMRLQHGDIFTASVVGKGSSFVFKIPLAK